MTLTMTGGGTETALCNRCGVWTKQEAVAVEKTESKEIIVQETGFAIIEEDKYTLLKCCGCETVSLLNESHFSGDGSEVVKRYPPSFSRRKPDWLSPFGGVPEIKRALLGEIYLALEDGSYRLCAVGSRALLEDIMVDCVSEQGTIGKNIDKFISDGYIAARSAADFRKRVIEAGHAAMHRGHQPSKSDISTLLDIAEGLLATIYAIQKSSIQCRQFPAAFYFDSVRSSASVWTTVE